MTISELYKSVAQLGFEETLESDARFFFAANRALLQVASLRPAKRAVTIHHAPLVNRVREKSFLPVQKHSDLYFEASGAKSFYFECDGEGEVDIERYDAQSGEWKIIGIHPLSSETRAFVPYRGFIKWEGAFFDGPLRLHFTGEHLYAVKNVAMYPDIYSDREEDIPTYGPFARYDIGKLASDFLALELPVMREDDNFSRMGDGYEVEDGRVLLFPYDSKGLYRVRYHHRPTPMRSTSEASTDTSVIDLDDELCALMPFLIASTLWADDEPQKAEYYLSIYRERASLLLSQEKRKEPVHYRTNGW